MKLPPWLNEGDPISAGWLNSWLRLCKPKKFGALPPLYVTETPDAILLRSDGARSSVKIKTGAAGIPAMVGATPGKATTVVRQTWAGESLAAASGTITVYNLSTTAVGANKYGKADWDDEGRLIIDVESCS